MSVSKTIKSSGGDYTSLSAWDAGMQADLTGTGYSEAVCYSFVDSTSMNIDGWTTTASDYILIRADSTARHAGKWDPDKYIKGGSSGPIVIYESYVRIDGIQVRVDASGTATLINLTLNTATSDIRCSNIIGDGATTSVCFIGNPTGGTAHTVTIWNCIGYRFNGTGGIIYLGNSAGLINAYNCTIYGSSARGFRRYDGTMNCYNCASFGNGTYDFLGTIGGSNNASSDTTAPGSDPLTSKTATAQFVDVDDGEEDFHLKAGADCINAGVSDPGSGLFSDDINGRTRSGSWDIGADEFLAAGQPTSKRWGGVPYMAINKGVW